MKCWKCGKDLAENAGSCVYCGSSQQRESAKTDAGKAMRLIYDRFGPEAVLNNKQYLTSALGDMLQDSKKLRMQMELFMEAGLGKMYLNQLQNEGKPNSVFESRVKKCLADDVGVSDSVAAEIMGYMDEMIGWKAVSGSSAASSSTKSSSTNGFKTEYTRLSDEAFRNQKTHGNNKINRGTTVIKNGEQKQKNQESTVKEADDTFKKSDDTSLSKMGFAIRQFLDSHTMTYSDSKKKTGKIWTSIIFGALAILCFVYLYTVPGIIIGCIFLLIAVAAWIPIKGKKHLSIYDMGNGQYEIQWDKKYKIWALCVNGKYLAYGSDDIEKYKYMKSANTNSWLALNDTDGLKTLFISNEKPKHVSIMNVKYDERAKEQVRTEHVYYAELEPGDIIKKY